ncbi:MAG TPA: acetyl-CoA carboxylase biotin carboxyl carrier protein subunit [Ktedonobacteraceae bacterium]
MERKRTTSTKATETRPVPEEASEIAEVMSIAQIQGLVKLLDRSDISELEVKRASEGVHLVLRKAKAQDGVVLAGEVVYAASGENGAAGESAANANRHQIVAPLVGQFHPWLKPRGGTLVAVGDRVKAGQLVGTIESLNVLNEVESTVAGRVVEIHVQDGQPVEYGQALVTIELAGAEEA